MVARHRAQVRGPALLAAGTGVIAVTYGLVRFGYGLYLPEFTATFGMSRATAGGVAAGSFAAYCLSGAVAYALLRQGWIRAALWLSCALTSIGAVAVACSWSTSTFAAGMLVAGSGAGAASPALVAAITSTIAPERVARGQAIVNSGTGAGVVAGGLAVTVAPENWRAAWIGFAVAALVVTSWADNTTIWRRRERRGRGERGRGDLGSLRRPLVGAAVAGTGSAAVWTFGRDLLISAGDVTPRGAGLLWVLLGAAGILGAASGDIVGRLGLRRAWALSTATAAVGTVLLASLPSAAPAAMVALLLFGGSYVALTGVLIAWGTHQTPERAGAATAILFIGLTVGQALGAALVGLISDLGGLLAAFYVAAAAILASSFIGPPSATLTRTAVTE
jgi:predicted MFS family arabinose efflux permease